MNTLLIVAQNGFSALPHPWGLALQDVALVANRVSLGLFFAVAGGHKLFRQSSRKQMLATLVHCRIPFPTFNLWFVSLVEFFGGLALLSGVLAPLASLGLLSTMAVACWTDIRPKLKTRSYGDTLDRVNAWLYQPEVLYMVGLLVVLAFGSPSYSLVDVVL